MHVDFYHRFLTWLSTGGYRQIVSFNPVDCRRAPPRRTVSVAVIAITEWGTSITFQKSRGGNFILIEKDNKCPFSFLIGPTWRRGVRCRATRAPLRCRPLGKNPLIPSLTPRALLAEGFSATRQLHAPFHLSKLPGRKSRFRSAPMRLLIFIRAESRK